MGFELLKNTGEKETMNNYEQIRNELSLVAQFIKPLLHKHRKTSKIMNPLKKILGFIKCQKRKLKRFETLDKLKLEKKEVVKYEKSI